MNRWNGEPVRNWNQYVEKRCIVVEDRPLGDDVEVEVVEVAPSGKYVKFKYPSGITGWEKASDWLLIESLPSNPV